MRRISSLLLACVVALTASGRASGATLEGFPGFTPDRVDFDGNVMIGSGTPGNRWEDGAWMQVPADLIDVSADGMRFTGSTGTYAFFKFTLSPDGSLSSIPLNEMVGGGRISPGGGTVVGSVLKPPDPNGLVPETFQAAAWVNGSTPTRYRAAEDGQCVAAASSGASVVTNTGIFGLTELYGCTPRPVIDRAYLTRWPGAVSLADALRLNGLVASDDGSAVAVRSDSAWSFLQGSGGFVPVPAEDGCDLTVLSANAGVAAGGACLWTGGSGWRPLADVLRDGGVDVARWTDFRIEDVSGDGRVVVGTARLDGARVGFRAALDGVRAPLVVTVTGDEANDATSQASHECDVDRAKNGRQCTLRAAIDLANARGGGRIAFDVPGDDVPAIQMTADSPNLPALTAPIVIDGTTQPGAGRVRLIGPGTFNSNRKLGIEIQAAGAGSTVRGLIVHGFRGAGILLRPGADECLIEDNWLGTDGDGIEALGNGGSPYQLRSGDESGGLVLLSDRNVVQANVLAGNGILDPETGAFYGGVDVLIGPEADLNHVRGNRIGVGADGQPIRIRFADNELADYVALVIAGGGGNVIGSPTAESAGRPAACVSPCNLIGGAIRVQTLDVGPPPSGTRIAGNFIGVDASAEPFRIDDDRGGGIDQFDAGSDTVVADNVIYDSIGQNVSLIGEQGHRITGNLFLADPAPSGLSADMLFGAVSMTDVDDVEVSGNEIGAGPNWGIVVSGESAGVVVSGNTITGRRYGGIGLNGTKAVALLRQNLTSDTPIGIDLGMDGITSNDPGDADGGANGLQNFPVMNAAALTGAALTLEGYFEVPFTTLSTYRLEVFSSSRCADGPLAAGGWPQGQAERYLGSASVDPLFGDVDFSFTLDGVADDHRFLALTASQPANGITSELSRCVAFASADEVARADVAADATGVVLDAQGATVAVNPAVTPAAAAATARTAQGAAPEGGRVYVTRYERVPSTNVFADATATGLAGTSIRPDAVAPRYWYISDRKLTVAGGGTDARTFEVCLDPTNVVRPVALRSVVVVRRDEATGGQWVPYATTTRRVRDDGSAYLCAASVPALGEFALGGVPAAFADGPPDACTPPPTGAAGAQCVCDTLPPLACDAVPASVQKAASAACGKVARAVGESKAKKVARLLKAARGNFKKSGKMLKGKTGRGLSEACRLALGQALQQGQERSKPSAR